MAGRVWKLKALGFGFEALSWISVLVVTAIVLGNRDWLRQHEVVRVALSLAFWIAGAIGDVCLAVGFVSLYKLLGNFGLTILATHE